MLPFVLSPSKDSERLFKHSGRDQRLNIARTTRGLIHEAG
jgi:hypothetical protein